MMQAEVWSFAANGAAQANQPIAVVLASYYWYSRKMLSTRHRLAAAETPVSCAKSGPGLCSVARQGACLLQRTVKDLQMFFEY